MPSIPCDVVILPDDQLATMAIQASKKLEPYGSRFTLEQGKYYPHSSLFMLQLKTSDLEQVKASLSKIAKQNKKMNLAAKRYYQAQAFIDVEYQRNEQIDNLQNTIVTALNPIRDGMREKDNTRMLEATGLAYDNFEQFGYKYVGHLFRPHITFTRFQEEQPYAEKTLPDLSQFDGTFTRIGLFEMGDDGTCIREIGSWELL